MHTYMHMCNGIKNAFSVSRTLGKRSVYTQCPWESAHTVEPSGPLVVVAAAAKFKRTSGQETYLAFITGGVRQMGLACIVAPDVKVLLFAVWEMS